MSLRRRAFIGLTLTLAITLISRSSDLGPTAVPYHAAFGHGSPVVLVHGLGSRPEHWFATARLLARDHRVVLVELPGHGDSPRADPLTLERATDALDAAIAEETREPVVLVGHSIGGLVAAAEAVRHPGRVRALVLVDVALAPQADATQRAAMLAALDTGYDALLRAAYESFGRDSAQGAELYAEAAALDSVSLKPWIRLALTSDISHAASTLTVPTLAVVSERAWEPAESWGHAERALGYANVPRLQHVRIRGTGHFIMLDAPGALAAAIERFIARPSGEPVAAR